MNQFAAHFEQADRAARQIELVLRHPGLSAKAKPPLEAAIAAFRGLAAIIATLSTTALHEALKKLRDDINRQGPALASAF